METKRFPWMWLSVSLILLIGPFVVNSVFVMPYAETTKDPDAIGSLSFVIGLFLVSVGFVSIITFAARLWLRN
jgi:hypothetical protein